jgi:hypothetical protein
MVIRPSMLRIDVEHAGGERLVALHGWLAGEEVGVFESSCATLDLPVRIDLTNLAGADDSGLAALHKQRERGARISGASPYIALRLEGAVGGVMGGDSKK